MKILFLTVLRIDNILNRNIHYDLFRKFADEGHEVYLISTLERRFQKVPKIIYSEGITIIHVRTLNFQKTNSIEKGLSSYLIEYQYLYALKKYLPKIRFDIVIYTTPPITFTKVISYVKKKHGTFSYLLLKDIFPQNAVDLNIIKPASLLFKYYRKKEQALYAISDRIGCMSPANIDFLIRNNPELEIEKVEINPNSIEIIKQKQSREQKNETRIKHGIPLDSVAFVYGGNLGKPQGISYLLKVMNKIKEIKEVFFIIVGSGTEYKKIKLWFDDVQPGNMLLLERLPSKDYDQLVQSCDVGLIFLDERFTIPNFPSRLLSYLEFELPVIAATDKHTDIGRIIEENNFGLWSLAGNVNEFKRHVLELTHSSGLRKRMGQNGFRYLVKGHDVGISYQIIMNHFPSVSSRQN